MHKWNTIMVAITAATHILVTLFREVASSTSLLYFKLGMNI